MARIRIEDLPVLDKLTNEEMEELYGAGRFSFRPSFEALEAREMMDAGLGHALLPTLAPPQGGATHEASMTPAIAGTNDVHLNRMFSALVAHQHKDNPAMTQGGIADLSGKSVTDALKAGSNWIIYEPKVSYGGQQVGKDQIRSELQMLYNKGFRGLVTYSFENGREEIPTIAKEVGFQQVIAGLWATKNYEGEKANLLAGNRLKDIDGLVVGNETQLRRVKGEADGLSIAELTSRVNEIKSLTNKPTTTADAWYLYLPDQVGAPLMKLGDWVFPNMHPYFEAQDQDGWHPHQNPVDGVTLVKNILRDHFNSGKTDGRTTALHESWWPSAAEGQSGSYSTSPQKQQLYFDTLSKTNVAFVYGEVFDQAWKSGEGTGDPQMGKFGGHWGLWQDANTPKVAVDTLYLGDRPR